jgi:serine-type D-Ala-D-Ala carboxypeptidase (penicillin-binding protein 5/6)
MSKSPFLPQGGSSRRARALARRRRRRRRVLAIGTMAVVIGAIAAVLVLTHSSLTHGSPSAAHTEGTHSDRLSHHGRGASSTAASSTPSPDAVSGSPGASGSSGSPTVTSSSSGASTLSPAGLPLGRPPLTLDLSGTEDPVQASFHRPPSAGLLFDLSTGRVLWQLNPQEHLHIASLTKMMTALRVVRTSSPDAPVLVTKAAVASAGSKVGVLPLGKDVRLETMLYGLLLPSGNDAAVALAQHVSGSEGAFVASMNQEAAHLGMGCTHYTSPSGYFNARNYSCAADLAELAHVDLEQPLIERIVRTEKAVEPLPIKGGKVYLYNNNPLLVYGYPGATGLKTGYTELAGDCLVGTAERHGVKLGVVLLHSPELGRQAEYLLDRGFEDAYGQAPIAAPPVPVGR